MIATHGEIGEGIETVLSATKPGLASPPAWAMTVANNLARLWVIPPRCRRLTILSDNDASGTERAAHQAVSAHNRAGVDAVIKRPRTVKDFNDLLRMGWGDELLTTCTCTLSNPPPTRWPS